MNRDDYDKPRQSRAKRSIRKKILIVTEGEVTESKYFELLKTHIELRKNQLDVHVECGSDHDGNTPSRVVSPAKKLRDAASERQRRRDDLGDLESREEYDEVWVVFDTEKHGERNDLKTAAEHAKTVQIEVAISRPSFESWFLIHLRDGLPAMATCSDVCREISKITKNMHGRLYRKDSKNNADLLWLIRIILPSTKDAISRSARLEHTAFSNHELVPDQSGTKVHKLVKVLWDASRRGSLDSAPHT